MTVMSNSPGMSPQESNVEFSIRAFSFDCDLICAVKYNIKPAIKMISAAAIIAVIIEHFFLFTILIYLVLAEFLNNKL